MFSILETLFSSTARVQILGLFLQKPGSRFYQREIERETGQPIRAVQREVERLENIGLLLRSEASNRVYYRVNPEFPLLEELTALFRQAAGSEQEGRSQPAQSVAPEPSAIPQPFVWMETLAVSPLPPSLRKLQVEGEWDRAY